MSENKGNKNDDNKVVFYNSTNDYKQKTNNLNSYKKTEYVPKSNAEKSDVNMNMKNIKPKQNGSNNVPKRKRSPYRTSVTVVCYICGFIMVLFGTGLVGAFVYLDRIVYEAIDQESSTQESSETSEVSEESEDSSVIGIDSYDGDLLNDPMVLNIMLFGSDRRSQDDNGNSDTMIILSIDTRHEKIKLLSLQRDTYVSIPGYSNNKLNAAYSIGGASLAVATVQSNYGIYIDRYAIIDFDSFEAIIDALGGIDIELTSEEIDYINWQSYTNNQVDTRYELDVNDYEFYENEDGDEVALVHLNSRQALWHARNRGQDGICSGDDFTRTQRQRAVINTILNSMKDADISTLLSIFYEVGPMITTNLKTSEITSLMTNATKYINYEVESQSLPVYSTIGTDFTLDKIYINGQNLDCIVITDWDVLRQEVAEFIYEENAVVTTTSY